MADGTVTTPLRTSASLVGGVLAAFGATACCFGPLLLVLLGAGGAWAGRLERLEPLQPYFYGLTLVFVGFAFHRLYIAPRRCVEGEACVASAVLRRQRIAFWAAVTLIAAMVASPLFAPFFY
ncbi:MAG TPA: mercuric transporter MerT family protein [Usitatibacter sp.]|nr:mercuric transporter MerT family protein [Usitatibacter sp.]